MKQLKCDYCGTVKEEIGFFIGAAKTADWCMVQGTGKMTCPACYEKAMAEGRAAIDRHVAAYNAS
jgi:sarcosine oxidase delta subunit